MLDLVSPLPIHNSYRLIKQIFQSSGLLWKVFSGVKKSTRESAAVFVLEKRALDVKYPGADRRSERERLLEQLKKSVSQLTR